MESLEHNHVPEQAQRIVDYLDQPFAVGDVTPKIEADHVAEIVHELSTAEKLAQLHVMDVMLEALNPKTATTLIPTMRAVPSNETTVLTFSHPAADTSPQAAKNKPTHKKDEIFVAP